jgi:hypothetical protein
MKANNRLCVPIYLITYSVEPNVRINKGNNKITELRTIFQRESKILQVNRGCWWRWFAIYVPPSSLNLVLLWQLFYLFCSSIVINTE